MNRDQSCFTRRRGEGARGEFIYISLLRVSASPRETPFEESPITDQGREIHPPFHPPLAPLVGLHLIAPVPLGPIEGLVRRHDQLRRAVDSGVRHARYAGADRHLERPGL